MATLREKLIDRTEVHIVMVEGSVMDAINHVATLGDYEIESVAYELKQLRSLKNLKQILEKGGQIMPINRETLFDVIEEMIDLDI